jgi:hypothetical protein
MCRRERGRSVAAARKEVKMNAIRRIGLVLVTCLALLAAGAARAAADEPKKKTFDASFSFEDTWTCPGVTITQSNDERVTIIELSPTSVQIQRLGVATLEANGKTLTSNFSAKIFLDPTRDVAKVVGTVYNIQVPGAGTLLLDAGSIVLDISTEPPKVLRVAGPHQQFFGDVAALCNYLTAA